jgi:hypothetical protein
MLPVRVHVGAVFSSGVEDADDDASGVALVRLLEVADCDAAEHPLTASKNAAPARVQVRRWVGLPR